MRALFWTIGVLIFYSATGNGQDFGGEMLLSAPLAQEYEQMLAGIRKAPEGSLAVMALIVAQALFLLLRTALGEILGIYRLLVLAILSVLATIGANILEGKTVWESLFFNSGTLMAYQVMFHQIKRQWEKRNEDRQRIALISDHGVHDEESPVRLPRVANRFKFLFRRNRRQR